MMLFDRVIYPQDNGRVLSFRVFIPCQIIVAGYYGMMLAVSMSVRLFIYPSACRPFVRPSVRIFISGR